MGFFDSLIKSTIRKTVNTAVDRAVDTAFDKISGQNTTVSTRSAKGKYNCKTESYGKNLRNRLFYRYRRHRTDLCL